MTLKRLKKTLRDFKKGRVSEEETLAFLNDLPYEDLGFAKVDHHRTLRHGFPEVIFGKGKTPEQIIEIGAALSRQNSNILITSAGENVFDQLNSRHEGCQFHENCQAVTIVREPLEEGPGRIGIFSAGTADIPVAEEALVTARFMGNQVTSSYDVGVAGLHRILDQKEVLRSCRVYMLFLS